MKKKIALVAGGYSGEYVISLGTAKTIEQNLDPEQFEVYKIIIDRNEWYYEMATGGKIVVDKNDFSLLLDEGKVTFDAAFIAVHGSPGEDGRLQGYFDMIGLPYTTCNAIVSALTFNKSFCNKVLKDYHIVHIANSVVLYKSQPYSLGAIMESLKLPVFVKPNESGSSLGVSKVVSPGQLMGAIDKAFAEDNQVLIEEFIEGRELTIGVYALKGKIHTLPPTEIVSKNDFFDYEAKYTPGVTNEITPAVIDHDVLMQLNRKAEGIYQHLNCKGIVRMDFILHKKTNDLFFLEVNTMPGQSENSIVPQQVRAAGLNLMTFYGNLLQEVLA
ncbi:D-alanine--D-alanine ligase [Taibaiella koreensis]|uniref:D-alanine--D-alanine ligase n=1 Tax=Taibaiella koreensis TaxID=1268548 RepID=UPI000E59F5E7|nr:D-alanine--D-alanine ligase [Taibaiella koreensis]